jgi:Chromate transporter
MPRLTSGVRFRGAAFEAVPEGFGLTLEVVAIDALEREPGLLDAVRDSSCEVASARESLVHGFETLLPFRDFLVRSVAVLHKVEGAAGLEYAADLLQGQRKVVVRRRPERGPVLAILTGVSLPAAGGVGALVWVAFKVGALSYGGGFVIIPLMQRDAVHTYQWMTAAQFLSAVALGQVTPGPVVQTVAVVGYAAAGIAEGLLAAAVAFAPSLGFVLGGGPYFERLRHSPTVQAFLTGAGPAAIGAIAGADTGR